MECLKKASLMFAISVIVGKFETKIPKIEGKVRKSSLEQPGL